MNVWPVILCGGSGSRLWPLSRGSYPKHLLPLIGDKTLLQQTAERLTSLGGPMVVVTNADHAFIVSRQLAEIGQSPNRLIVEPIARGTAPAVALALLDIARQDAEAIVIIAPSDHLIMKTDAFEATVADAARLADQGFITTIGVTATAPETGYGYIQRGEPLAAGGFVVDRFVEKPDREKALALIDSGICDWNSGMFVAKAATLLAEMDRHTPEMLAACKAAMDAADPAHNTLYPSVEPLQSIQPNSIDYAVMEVTDRAAVVPADLGWSDLGSWSALWQVSDDQDENGNVLVGDVAAVDSRNCYVRSSDNLVAVVGVDNLVVVSAGDAVVVSARDRSEDVKAVVDRLRDWGRREVSLGRTVQHPWGSFTVLTDSPEVCVRRISIHVNSSMSEVPESEGLRRLAWTVIAGQGSVELDGRFIDLVAETEAAGGPGRDCAITNTGNTVLELIEVARPVQAFATQPSP